MTDAPASIVCIANSWFPASPGGLDRYVYEMAYNLAASADRVELCGVEMPDESTDTSKASAVKLTNLADPASSLIHRFWQVRKNYPTGQLSSVDAINLHFALYSFPLLNRLPDGIPVTFHFHGPWASESDQEGASKLGVLAKRWLEKQVYQRCDRFIVLSKAFGQILHDQYHIPWDKIHVIPGGVNTESFQLTMPRSDARTELGWPQDRFILFTPRRLVHRMGLKPLLEAIARIKRQSAATEIWLAIAGKGPLRSHLEQQVVALGLQENVKFLGFLPEKQLPIAYQAADLTVMPSQSLEGFGLVLLESLACGTPTLCTPIGGMPEVIANFSPELITASAETDEIAQTLKDIATGRLTLPKREACRSYAVENFGWTTIAKRVRKILLMPVA
ncbi:MAG: glycosyltransferase family 4 protein [Cyanobacteria bacterium J06623_5]